MNETGVRVVGLNQLVRTLQRAEIDLADLKDAHRRVGEIVATWAQTTVPRRSGQLAGTIRASRQARRAQVVAGGKAVPYAAPIHWGWPARGIAANPFLSEAAQASEPRWTGEYRRDVQAALDKVKGA